MAPKSADPSDIREIRRLASDPGKAKVTTTVEYDLLAHHLTKEDICDEIVAWIDAGERVRPTVLHTFPGLQRQPAFEMKPIVGGSLFYLKVTLVQLGQPGEYMLLISAHPDH